MPSSVGEIITLEPGWDEEDVDEQVDLTIETLHEDAIEHVITKLDQQDLCNFSQASKLIKAKTSRPKFWELIKVSKTKIQQEGLPKLFLIDKFKQVQRIDLTSDQCIEVLDACIASTTLNHVDMSGNDLQQVPAEQLANAVGNLKTVKLKFTRLTTEQCTAVLKKCESSKVTDVDLSEADLRQVSPQLLGEAIRNVQRMRLMHAKVTSEQRIVILNAVFASSVTVHMYLSDDKKASLPDGLFIQAKGTGRLLDH